MFERDKEACCGNCPWWIEENHKTGFCQYTASESNEDERLKDIFWCAQHPLNRSAEERWLDGQKPISIKESAELLGGRVEDKPLPIHFLAPDMEPMSGENAMHKRISQAHELMVLRKQLELTQAQLAACAAGLWEDYDEAKHKDGKWLIEFVGNVVSTSRWDIDGWQHGLVNPIRVAELREDVLCVKIKI